MTRVSGLFIYPVKGCGGISLPRARVVERGLELDRRYMLIDETGAFVTQRTQPKLARIKSTLTQRGFELSTPGQPRLPLPANYENGSRHEVTVWDDKCVGVLHETGSRWFSTFLGSRHCLVFMPSDQQRAVNPARGRPGDIVSFADAYPLLLISEASLADLNSRLPSPVTMQRFRPNIVIDGCAPYAEDELTTLSIGELTFRAVKRCDRCSVTTVEPETGDVSTAGEPLRTLATFRKQDGKVWFGMNLIHDGLGELSVGDTLTAL